MSSFPRLLLLSALTLPLFGARISSYTLTYNGNSVAAGGLIDNGQPGYQITGDLDLYDNVTLLPVTGGELTGFSFRFTRATIACIANCGPLVLTFGAVVNFTGAPPTDWTNQFGLDGSGPAGGFLTAVLSSGANSTSISNVSSQGSFNQAVLLPPSFFAPFNGSNSLAFDMALILENGLADGAKIDLPSSLFVQLNSVPEPGTMAIVGAGLVGALWFRRRIN
ncbi:MAG: PEP-CTERM sorting domain-containing protein [Bryobacteraceae bacterium]|nr:PEP-CTERM sorting domain-containing protein [Bryobacteraceae bacterium]